MEAFLSGRREAFDVIVERHRRQVYQVCFRFVNNHEDAADLAQDVFVRAWERLTTFRGQSALATWLHRLTINACRDVGNRQRVRACEPLLEDRRAASDADPVHEADRTELRRELNRWKQ